MGIGASDGAFYEDHFDRITGVNGNEESGSKPSGSTQRSSLNNPSRIYVSPNRDRRDEINPGEATRDQNVVTPGEMFQNKEMDSIQNNELGGTEVAFKTPLGGSTEPAGALKPTEGSLPPGKGSEINWEGFNQPFGTLKDTNPAGKTIATIPAMKQMGLEGSDITERDINKATDVAMSAGGGGLTFGGVKSQSFAKKSADLVQAHILEGNGAHPEDIWRQTGLMRGADKRWRYEIDDSKMKFDKDWASNPTAEEKQFGIKIKRLDQVIDHPELFDAYPSLRNIPVRYDHSNKSGGASWNGKVITVGQGSWNKPGIIMHEVQHAIQDIEGFAQGGAPGEAGKHYNLKLDPLAKEKIEKPLKMLLAIQEELGGLPAELQPKASELIALAKKYTEYEKAGNIKAFENYEALAGETEARNVDTRLLLSKEARRNQYPPTWTEDVPRYKQKVKDVPTRTTPYD